MSIFPEFSKTNRIKEIKEKYIIDINQRNKPKKQNMLNFKITFREKKRIERKDYFTVVKI